MTRYKRISRRPFPRSPQKTKRIRKAMARPKRPVASASAKPRNAKGCTCPCAAGLRATELISAENTLPMPIPAPTRAMHARPAPIILAEARSIWFSVSSEVRGEGASVEVDSVAKIEACEDGEHVGLQRRDEDFQCHEQDIDTHRQNPEEADTRSEAGKNSQHRVPGKHVGEEPDRQGERANEIRQQLDRHEQQQQHHRHPLRD